MSCTFTFLTSMDFDFENRIHTNISPIDYILQDGVTSFTNQTKASLLTKDAAETGSERDTYKICSIYPTATDSQRSRCLWDSIYTWPTPETGGNTLEIHSIFEMRFSIDL